MERELSEELAVETSYDEQLVGFIFDDSTPIGEVHIGVVHLLRLAEPKVTAREDDLAESGFQPVDQLKQSIDTFETWSQLCLRHLF
jgi:predicted NUDIX family phosphoesterase